MKKLLLTTMIVTAFVFNNETKAQIGVNLNVHIGARPNWGVQGNYNGNYYYLPEIDCYYDIAARQFIYFDNGNWVYAYDLPYAYRNYDLYGGYKVVVNEYRPYLHADFYRQRYNSYYNAYAYRRPVVIDQRRYGGGYRNDHFDYGRDDRNRYNEHFENRGHGEEHFERNGGRDNRGWDNDRGRGFHGRG